MDLKGCRETALEIDSKYLEPICPVAIRDENGKTLGHLRWMVQEIQLMTERKAMRWLGYIQGILVGVFDISLEDMKAISKSHADEDEYQPGDLVYLKSGSPKMTIVEVRGKHCNVVWSAYGSDVVQERLIPSIAFRKAQHA